jgi:thioesterase domain-containing protein
MVWGLAPGWWAFADDLRRDSTHVDAATWLRVLGEVGLTDIAAVPMDFDADHVLLLGARTPVGAQSPVERVAEEVRRQATQGGYEALLYLPRLDGQTDAAEAVRLWSELCSHPTARGLRQAFAVTEDPGAESGWRAERLRRGMDPVEGEPPETGWRHVEVPQLGAAELAALSRLLAQRGLPAVVRLELAGAVAEGASTSEAAAGSEPAAPARRDELEPGAAAPALDPLRQALADLWCDVLGVPVVAEADDFFESGGESLMAIFFLGRVRDRLNIAIEVTAFMASPTFGHLLALAQEPHADLGAAPAQGSPVRNLVVFRGGGSRRPLFLTAPAAGSSLCYRDLAALLDDRQPCYGIDCPGVFDGGMPLTRLEDLAAHHIEVIRHVRPHGPYLLGGWSVGAMVAHEMVRQLAQQGEVVDLLVCIDGYVPDTGGRPLATSPRHLVVGLARLLQPGPRLRMAGGLGRTAELSGGNTGMPDLARVYRASVLAMLRYVPGRVPSRAVVFKTGLDADRRAHLGRRLAPLYEGGVEVRPAPGSHWTVLDPGHIVELARELRDVLVRLEPEG